MQVQELVGIVPWTFIAQICNLFIQVYLIKRFLFKPINEMLEKRRAMADAEIQDAVKAKDEANARILLGSNSLPVSGFSIEDALSGSFTTTEADKDRRYQVYLEEELKKTIEMLDNVKEVKFRMNIPTDDGTLIAQKEPTYVAAMLDLDGEMDEEQAAGLARLIAVAVGNDNTDEISIMDTNNNTLFAGGDETTTIGAANSQLTLRQKYEQAIKKSVKAVSYTHLTLPTKA